MRKRIIALMLTVLMMCSLLQTVSLTVSAECVPPTDWSETYPTGVPAEQIESKIEYRYRGKEHDSGSSNSKPGWELEGSSYEWSDWTNGSGSGDDQTRTVYYYYYYLCPNCGAHMHVHSTCWEFADGCGYTGSDFNYGTIHEFYSTTPYSQTKNFHDTSRLYTDSTEQGRAFIWPETSQYYVAPIAQHRYKIWTYSFWRWSPEWSSWSENEVTATDNRQVEMRTLYRVVGGHDYVAEPVKANCEQRAGTRYTCSICGDSYVEYEPESFSEWFEVRPEWVSEEFIESKTEYRYSDYDCKESDATSMPGYTVKSSRWEQTGTGSVQYVSSWPSGFNTGLSIYSTYNKSPMKATETATAKTEITGTSTIGYIWWHWCRNDPLDGPNNRLINATQNSEFVACHAFFSETSPAERIAAGARYDSSDNSYVLEGTAAHCMNTYWFFPIAVYQQNYKTSKKMTTFERWTDWSEWSEEEVTETDTRRVETRTMYRYVTNPLGEHDWSDWEITTPATCTEDGEKARTCTVCQTVETEAIPAAHTWDAESRYCIVCEAENPDYIPLGVKVGSVRANPGDTVTIPVTITENPGFAGFTFKLDLADELTLTAISKGELLNSSESGFFNKDVSTGLITWFSPENITGDGTLFTLTVELSENAEPLTPYAISISLRDNEPTNFVDEDTLAIPLRLVNGGVNIDPHEHVYTEDTTPATCTEDGVTVYTCECGDTYSEVIPKLEHDIVIDAAVPPTCIQDGLTEGEHCTRCDYAIAQETIAALGHDMEVTAAAVPASCTETGLTEAAHCTRCDYETQQETIEPLGHDIIETVLLIPNCTEEGASEFMCTRCDYYEAKFTPALGHDYVEE
ncbi:MAG: cohesin domain-containing protein, partial [Faecousia sp.]